METEISKSNPALLKEAKAIWNMWDEDRQLEIYWKAVEAGFIAPEETLYPMEDFNRVMSAYSPLEIARMTLEGDFDLFSEYFNIGFGNYLCAICSADLPDFLGLVSDDVIRYMESCPEVWKA